MRLKNKVAVVTGAAEGIGKAITTTYARQGAKVIATDINTDKLSELIDNVQSEGYDVIGLRHDVSSRTDWFDEVISTVVESYGKIDILVNNAGIALGVPFEEQTEESWRRVYGINLDSVMLGIQAVLPHMKGNGGSIINISSIAAITGTAGVGAYTASKGGVYAITRAGAIDYAPFKIRVNAIVPGNILTAMSEPFLTAPEYQQHFLSQIPLACYGSPQDIADAALFLASDESLYVTGINLPVDGGWTAK